MLQALLPCRATGWRVSSKTMVKPLTQSSLIQTSETLLKLHLAWQCLLCERHCSIRKTCNILHACKFKHHNIPALLAAMQIILCAQHLLSLYSASTAKLYAGSLLYMWSHVFTMRFLQLRMFHSSHSVAAALKTEYGELSVHSAYFCSHWAHCCNECHHWQCVCCAVRFHKSSSRGVIFSRTTCIADGDANCKLVVEQ